MWRDITRLSVMLATLAITISSVEAQDVWLEPGGELSQTVGETTSKILADILPVQGYMPQGMPPYGAPPYAQEGSDGALYQRPIPDRPMWFSSQDPHQKEFRSFEGWFVRAEYLNWTFQRPGNVLVGAPIWDNLTNPDRPTNRTFNLGTDSDPILYTGFFKNPSLEPIGLNNANGARGTLGIPLTFGSLEASVFGFHSVASSFSAKPQEGTIRNPFYAVSTYVDGVPGDIPTFFLFDAGFTENYSSSLYGAESNLIFDGIGPTTFFSIKPMAGVRYLCLSEELAVQGATTDIGNSEPIHRGFISTSDNRMWMGQAGLRFQFDLPRFTFTFDPKYALGSNSFANDVGTLNMAGSGKTWDKSTNIANLVDLGMTGRIQLSEYFTFTAGYNFIWLGGVSRAGNNLQYNVNGTMPAVYVDSKKTDMTLQGFSVGGEITYR
ncbi:MAG: BBP7 family outer membrane beta-barrel protein [Planctomycetales bacterium]